MISTLQQPAWSGRALHALLVGWWALYLLMVTPLSWPLVTNEFLSYRSILTAALAFVLIGMVVHFRKTIQASMFQPLIALQCLLMVLSNLRSPSTSGFLIGHPFYQDGALHQMSFALVVISVSLLRPHLDEKRLLTHLASTTILVETPILLLQKLGWDVLGFITQNGHYNTVMGTTGNEAITAYLLLLSGLWLLSQHSAAWMILVSALGLSLTGNLTAAAAFVAVSFVWMLGQLPTPWTRWLMLLGVLLMGKFMVPTLWGDVKTREDRVRGDTFHTRLLFWETAVQQMTQHPGRFLMGYGSSGFAASTLQNTRPEHLYQSFYKPFFHLEEQITSARYLHPNPEHYVLEVTYREGGELKNKTIHDQLVRAHNLVLDSILSGGWLCGIITVFFFLSGITLWGARELHWASLIFFLTWFAFPTNHLFYGLIMALTHKKTNPKNKMA